jgi:hypothetical protein
MFALEIYAAMAFGATIGFLTAMLMRAGHDSDDEQESKHARK